LAESKLRVSSSPGLSAERQVEVPTENAISAKQSIAPFGIPAGWTLQNRHSQFFTGICLGLHAGA